MKEKVLSQESKHLTFQPVLVTELQDFGSHKEGSVFSRLYSAAEAKKKANLDRFNKYVADLGMIILLYLVSIKFIHVDEELTFTPKINTAIDMSYYF